MSFDISGLHDFHSLSISDDGTLSTGIPAGETPRSNLSAGLDGSVFGSGSSVLSQWEPPTDADLSGLCPNQAAIAQLLEESAHADGSLKDLETVISRLQAIYLYRQGLKALAEESLGAVTENSMANSNLVGGDSTSNLVGSRMNTAPQMRQEAAPTIPGSTNSIWRMNSPVDTPQLTPQQTQAPQTAMPQYQTVVPTQDLAALARLQYQLYQDTLRRYKKSRHGGRQSRYQRRKPRRSNSAPVTLRAPQWADASWHPMTAVLAKGDGAGAGTGVFIPAALAEQQNAQKAVDAIDATKKEGSAKRATPADLPEEWLY